MKPITIHVDGATASPQRTGIAAIARTPQGHFLGWLSRQLSPMTNNEAEYHSALLGLQLAQHLHLTHLEIISDSQVLVRQMQGLSQVHSPRLKPLHQQTCTAVQKLPHVTFRHVSRNHNQLADALATEALHGQLVTMPPTPHKTPWQHLLHILRKTPP